MQSLFLSDTTSYDGSQLSAQWVRQHMPDTPNSIIAFIGPANVRAEHMVDLEDLANEDWIYSESMLHFIISHHAASLETTVLRQHLFVHQLIECLRAEKSDIALTRSGDDIMDGHYKLSVSIATTGPNTGLIHTALNISSTNTPVPTRGLDDYGINPETFAHNVFQLFLRDDHTMHYATTKVKAVTI